ncbi:heme peroxidase [Zopfia rhizophila CBS 207.26]|uniref:Heme peroxidase n=1 Tax=Zopfia rhizophila CBS 207.26 TaxID=1314779 RepID=A0A6A6E6C9_9PEZI|nr:heme peroxidase [Zopfia rhizophila CBS 207.26]
MPGACESGYQQEVKRDPETDGATAERDGIPALGTHQETGNPPFSKPQNATRGLQSIFVAIGVVFDAELALRILHETATNELQTCPVVVKLHKITMFAPDDLGPTTEITAFTLTSLSTLVVGVRFYCRIWIAGKLRLYDWIMLAALLCTWGICVINHYQILYGTGMGSRPRRTRPVSLSPEALQEILHDVLVGAAKSWYTYQIFYLLDLALIKFSILVFYLSIATKRTFRWLVIITIAVVAIFTVVMVLVNAFECPKRPSDALSPLIFNMGKNGCLDLNPIYYGQAGFNIFSDIWILFLAMPVLIKLRTPRTKRVALLVVFSVGGIAPIASIFRIWAIHIWATGPEARYSGAYIIFWSQVEINTAIICASIPSLQPLFWRVARELSRISRRGTYVNYGNGWSSVPEVHASQGQHDKNSIRITHVESPPASYQPPKWRASSATENIIIIPGTPDPEHDNGDANWDWVLEGLSERSHPPKSPQASSEILKAKHSAYLEDSARTYCIIMQCIRVDAASEVWSGGCAPVTSVSSYWLHRLLCGDLNTEFWFNAGFVHTAGLNLFGRSINSYEREMGYIPSILRHSPASSPQRFYAALCLHSNLGRAAIPAHALFCSPLGEQLLSLSSALYDKRQVGWSWSVLMAEGCELSLCSAGSAKTMNMDVNSLFSPQATRILKINLLQSLGTFAFPASIIFTPSIMTTVPPSSQPYKLSFTDKALVLVFKGVNWLIPWHKLPTYIGVFNLSAYRKELRQKNLHDVYPSPDYQGKPGCPHMENNEYLSTRNSDGLFNALDQPKMGCMGMRFGRNVPREFTKKPTVEEMMTPNPRVISQELLARDKFKPATILNLLAAAWIQFQVHDWFQHSNSKTESYDVPLSKSDNWPSSTMKIEATEADKALDKTDLEAPAYANENTHWWDGSQIYGSTEARTRELRGKAEKGKLHVDVQNMETFLPRDEHGIPITGFLQNWWTGLEMMHTLFVLEHNAICDELALHYPDWTNEQLFDTARLVNCALMAKIHTVEWTPAILAHPALDVGMHAQWWGILGEKLYKMLGRVSKGESLSGIPGSVAEQHGAPYSLTEEFVSVYRMHPLIPDNIAFFDAETGSHTKTYPFQEVAFENARKPIQESKLKFEDLFYSFGINYPGAVTLNNYPAFLRDLHTPDGRHIDLATVEILRDRERGVPRYNQFRRLFHLKPATSFLNLTGNNKPVAERLEKIYEGDIEKVDLLAGCLCEPLPKGFGFSDTAFRVFILMASRRLKSDRFIATEWNEDVYSKVGMKWVQDGGFKDMLGRHFPVLKGALRGVKNPFAPWGKVGSSAEYKGVETNA